MTFPSQALSLVAAALALSLTACGDPFGPGKGDDRDRVLYMDHTGLVLAPGDVLQLTATVEPPDALRYRLTSGRWWSDDESVVHSRGGGLIEAVGTGRTTIWVEAEGRRDSARVVVWDPGEPPAYRWKAVSLGEMHACALTEAGVPYCWGRDNFGELGAGTRGWITASLVPTRVVDDHAFETVTTGTSLSCGLNRFREAWCWGLVELTGSGIRHDERIPDHHVRARPERVDFPRPIARLASTYYHSCLLDEDGTAYCWGNNMRGQLGLGHFDLDTPPRPNRVATEVRFSDIQPLSHSTCAVSTHGELFCWGDNHHGQLGRPPSSLPYATPQHIPAETPMRALAGIGIFYQGSCAVDAAGGSNCWGVRGFSLGLADSTRVWTPTRLAQDPGFDRLVTGGAVTCGLDTEGTAKCWGGDVPTGILGADHVSDICQQAPCNLAPTPITGGHRFRDLSIGSVSACGVTVEGALYCWGNNRHHQLGLGRPDVEAVGIPMRVPDPF